VAQTEKMMRQARNNLQNRNQEDDDFEWYTADLLRHLLFTRNITAREKRI
jgi:hypothetical protein